MDINPHYAPTPCLQQSSRTERLDLKKALEKAESEIDFSKTGSPIHDVLHSIDRDKSIIQLSQNDSKTGQEVLPYILDKLNRIEDAFLTNRSFSSAASPFSSRWKFQFSLQDSAEKSDDIEVCSEWSKTLHEIPEIDVYKTGFDPISRRFTTYFSAPAEISPGKLRGILEKALSDVGITAIGSSGLIRII